MAEVEIDFEWARAQWLEMMGICEDCEPQFCREEVNYGSIDASSKDFDFQAFKFDKI